LGDRKVIWPNSLSLVLRVFFWDHWRKSKGGPVNLDSPENLPEIDVGSELKSVVV